MLHWRRQNNITCWTGLVLFSRQKIFPGLDVVCTTFHSDAAAEDKSGSNSRNIFSRIKRTCWLSNRNGGGGRDNHGCKLVTHFMLKKVWFWTRHDWRRQHDSVKQGFQPLWYFGLDLKQIRLAVCVDKLRGFSGHFELLKLKSLSFQWTLNKKAKLFSFHKRKEWDTLTERKGRARAWPTRRQWQHVLGSSPVPAYSCARPVWQFWWPPRQCYQNAVKQTTVKNSNGSFLQPKKCPEQDLCCWGP